MVRIEKFYQNNNNSNNRNNQPVIVRETTSHHPQNAQSTKTRSHNRATVSFPSTKNTFMCIVSRISCVSVSVNSVL